MKWIYFDQNITKELCNNFKFSQNFLQQFKAPPTLIITPRTLIELSGVKIKDCLKDQDEYSFDFSDSLSNQVVKAIDFCENGVKGDIIPLLERGLKKQKNYIQTRQGQSIFIGYLDYLNSVKGFTEILSHIVFDRVSTLPLEQFQTVNTYLEICRIALYCLSQNPHNPIIKLLIKSYKKLPTPRSEEEKKRRKILRALIEKSDLKQDGDLVDTELIQFAVMGYRSESVHFYTKDNSSKIENRLRLLYQLLKVLKPYFEEKLKEGVDVLKSKNLAIDVIQSIASLNFIFGKISIIDDFGNVSGTIDVQNLLSST